MLFTICAISTWGQHIQRIHQTPLNNANRYERGLVRQQLVKYVAQVFRKIVFFNQYGYMMCRI